MKKRIRRGCFVWGVGVLLFGCNGSATGGSDANLSADQCTLTQTITADDPDGNPSNISDITQATTSQATTNCLSTILDNAVIQGKQGTIAITQNVTDGETTLTVDLKDLWPFSVAPDVMTGTRTATDFTTMSSLHLAIADGNCEITLTFGGTIQTSPARIKGTLYATVHRPALCRSL